VVFASLLRDRHLNVPLLSALLRKSELTAEGLQWLLED